MTDLVRIDPFRWPYSLADLRRDEPASSFSDNPSDAEYLLYGCYRKVPQPHPIDYDPATQKVVEIAPTLVDDQWLQQWEIVSMTAEEQENYYRQNNPPDWYGFNNALPTAQIDQLLAAVGATSVSLGYSIPIGLSRAADGDEDLFLDRWQQIKDTGLVPEELSNTMRDLAIEYHLPAEFVAGL